MHIERDRWVVGCDHVTELRAALRGWASYALNKTTMPKGEDGAIPTDGKFAYLLQDVSSRWQ